MLKVLAVCKDRNAAENILPALFEYSQLFSLQFYIADTNEDILAVFMRQRPQLFMVYDAGDANADVKFLQQLSPTTPVIVISPAEDELAAVEAYQSGVIDYVHLPCGSREFYYRLAARLRLLQIATSGEAASSIWRAGNLAISLRNNQVRLGSEFIPLTTTEYKLLVILATNLNCIVTTEQLYADLWNVNDMGETSRTLSMHISKLRHKLGFNKFTPLNIVTIHKKGYSLRTNGSTQINAAEPVNIPIEQQHTIYTANVKKPEANYANDKEH